MKRLLRAIGLVRETGSESARRGRLGESMAEQYLISEKGFRVLRRNWRAGKGEIDLICMDGPVLVFVEVRSRDHRALVSGYHTINRHKKKVLRTTCYAYLKECRPRPRTYRFDVAEVHLGTKDDPVRHFSNIPLFPSPSGKS